MKHVNQLGFVVLLLVLITLPVAAANVSVMSSTVIMATGGGTPPVVMAKWETDNSSSFEDGDSAHKVSGSQFNPPLTFEGTKALNYYAVVTDAENNGNVLGTYADVYHPDGKFKYQIHMAQLSKADGIAAFNAASPNGTIKLGPGSANTPFVLNELNKGTASVWKGTADIHYCQMDGNYQVAVRTVDQNQNPSVYLNNTFYYTPISAAEYDFSSVNYGSVSMGATAVWRAGDVFFANGDGKPTIRNVGNTRLKINITQDDMGFGKDVNGVWNVKFDARLGDTSVEQEYAPFTTHTLVDILDRSHTDELDFSIHVFKGFDAHSGNITLNVINADIATLPNNP